MLLVGIFLGLGCAVLSSVGYLISRRFTVRHAAAEPGQPTWRGPLRLLVATHVYLGLACSAVFAVLLPRAADQQPADWAWAVTTTLGCGLFYMIGNATLFLAIRRAEASRIAPLLGFKVVLLALATHFGFHDALAPQQWLGVALATGAAMMLGVTGGRMPVKTLLLILACCAGFVGSDLFIRLMVRAWLPAGLDYADADGLARVRASMTGMALVYVWCGVTALALLPIAKIRHRSYWRSAAPYAAAWLSAMACLFSAHALVGIVLGTILQSTRGLVSIGLGVVVARRGHHHLETHAPWPVVVQRLFAAALMTAAIVLFVTA